MAVAISDGHLLFYLIILFSMFFHSLVLRKNYKLLYRKLYDDDSPWVFSKCRTLKDENGF